MIKQGQRNHDWTCALCKGSLLIHERAQLGLPSICTKCMRSNQSPSIKEPPKSEAA